MCLSLGLGCLLGGQSPGVFVFYGKRTIGVADNLKRHIIYTIYRMNKDFTVMPEKTLTDEELFEMMKNHPEFENLPKPASWFKKFNLEPIKARNFKEFIDDKAWEKAREMIVDEREIRKEPVPGGVRPVLPSEEIPVEIISRPIGVDEVWGLVEEQKKAKLDFYEQLEANLSVEDKDLIAQIESKAKSTSETANVLSH